jgi:acetyl-CoA carboxylase biotin carboxyl carrier protein
MALTEIRSEMAGSVLKILVTVDDVVEAGTPVIVLESMKMEIPIVVPFRGRVVEIFVAEAASVLGDQLMATLERVEMDGLT